MKEEVVTNIILNPTFLQYNYIKKYIYKNIEKNLSIEKNPLHILKLFKKLKHQLKIELNNLAEK